MQNVIYILKQCWEIWKRNCKLLAFLRKIWPHLGRCACEKCFAENGTINILHGTHTPRHITTAPVLIESFQFRASKETKSSLTRKFVIWFSISTILHQKIFSFANCFFTSFTTMSFWLHSSSIFTHGCCTFYFLCFFYICSPFLQCTCFVTRRMLQVNYVV